MAWDDDLEDLIDELEERYPELDSEEIEAIAESMLEANEQDPEPEVFTDLDRFIDYLDGYEGYYDEYDVETSPDYGGEE